MTPIAQEFDDEYSQTLYPCTSEIKNQKQLIVRSLDANDSSLYEYAVSFRVKKWVNVSLSVLVLPFDATGYDEIDKVLVRRNVMITVVTSPLNRKSRPTYARWGYVDKCPTYMPDLTCFSLSNYLAFFGPDPGLLMRNSIKLGLKGYPYLYSRSTATTILSTDDCVFCLYTRLERDCGTL
ncbi:unnamed protein product, partial [Mesorhabditis belari]|uniref:Uncharacterized protein n=1 Tax=Mesorhabditis belari TaxID=2138241 RepID=A0AAF3F7I2_9BILA